MNCIKRMGEQVMSKTFERQVNELHIRAAILNRFTELGRPQTVTLAQLRLGPGQLSFNQIYATAPCPIEKSTSFPDRRNQFSPQCRQSARL